MTGVSNVRYTVENKTKVVIEGAPVTFLNIHLHCDITLTPWCLKPEDHKLLLNIKKV